jgi:hypothetical protein
MAQYNELEKNVGRSSGELIEGTIPTVASGELRRTIKTSFTIIYILAEV